MENFTPKNLEQKFSSPQEELEYLRREVVRREKELSEKGQHIEREKVIAEKVENYNAIPAEKTLHPDYKLQDVETEAIVLNLAPEAHDRQIEEVIAILQEKGIKNALAVLEKMNSPHLYDDFHRFLVQYIKAGFLAAELKDKDPLLKKLKMSLFEVSLPEILEDENKGKKMAELISGMEQFYAGMLSVIDDGGVGAGYFTLELTNSIKSTDLVFYVAIPDTRIELFEKQVIAIFPDAKISESKDDYNAFNDKGVSLGAYAKLDKNPIYPLRTYDSFDHDPLVVLLNVFSRLNKEDEAASVQIVFHPCGERYNKLYKQSIEDLNKGKKLKEAIDHDYSITHIFGKVFKDTAKDIVSGDNKKEDDKKDGIDEKVVQLFRDKAGSRVVEINLRVVASSGSKDSAATVMSDLQSAFHQFENPLGNRLEWKKMEGKKLEEFFRDFSLRTFSADEAMPINLKELTSLMHFPGDEKTTTPHLKQVTAKSAPAPADIPTKGVLLGVNQFRGVERQICFAPEDRMRHFYVIGQTGTGKTTILKNMIAQDIANGEGVCFIDPHGSDIQDILSTIPKERYEDVIYFDPAYADRPMGLNMLEYDRRFPMQKTFVVNEMLSIFNKLFDMKTAGGPMFEQYFRNAVMLVIEDPDTGNTLLDVSRVLSNKAYRELKLTNCKNPIVVQFWREVAEKAGGEASLANIVPYITSKFDVFLSNEIMRPIVSQEKSTFNFRQIMDEKKIFLVNLSKGTLGDINSSLLGLIIVGKFLMAALSRVDSFGQELPPFYLYIDEFQNVTTNSISQILSEARKYKLSLNIAHQYIKQLDEGIRDAVFGNVGSMAIYRVGTEDAEFLEKQLAPTFVAKDIMNIENYNAYMKMLANGRPTKPFNIRALVPPKGNKEIVDKLKQLSYLKYGQDRAEVEEEIMKKYQKQPPAKPPLPFGI